MNKWSISLSLYRIEYLLISSRAELLFHSSSLQTSLANCLFYRLKEFGDPVRFGHFIILLSTVPFEAYSKFRWVFGRKIRFLSNHPFVTHKSFSLLSSQICLNPLIVYLHLGLAIHLFCVMNFLTRYWAIWSHSFTAIVFIVAFHYYELNRVNSIMNHCTSCKFYWWLLICFLRLFINISILFNLFNLMSLLFISLLFVWGKTSCCYTSEIGHCYLYLQTVVCSCLLRVSKLLFDYLSIWKILLLLCPFASGHNLPS